MAAGADARSGPQAAMRRPACCWMKPCWWPRPQVGSSRTTQRSACSSVSAWTQLSASVSRISSPCSRRGAGRVADDAAGAEVARGPGAGRAAVGRQQLDRERRREVGDGALHVHRVGRQRQHQRGLGMAGVHRQALLLLADLLARRVRQARHADAARPRSRHGAGAARAPPSPAPAAGRRGRWRTAACESPSGRPTRRSRSRSTAASVPVSVMVPGKCRCSSDLP